MAGEKKGAAAPHVRATHFARAAHRAALVAELELLVELAPADLERSSGRAMAAAAGWDATAAEWEAKALEYDAASGHATISVAALKAKLAGGGAVTLIDCRLPHEHSTSSLENALLLTPRDPNPLTSAPMRAAAELPPALEAAAADASATLVCFCTAGYRSGYSALDLQQRLGREVLNLHGGIISWFNAKGGCVVPASGEPTSVVHTFGKAWQPYVNPAMGVAEISGPAELSSQAVKLKAAKHIG